MLAGRVLFGIGGESIGVVQSSITTAYFRNKELAFALGLNLCISRLGSVVNSVLSPRIAAAVDTPAAVWVGSLMCYMSLGCAALLSCIVAVQEHATSPVRRSQSTTAAALSEETTPLLQGHQEFDSPASDLDIAGDDRIFASAPHADSVVGSGSGSRTLGSNGTSPSSSHGQQRTTTGCMAQLTGVLSDLRASQACLHLFPASFWILCAVCILLYGTVIPFNNIASDFLMSKWYPDDTVTAGIVMSIPDTTSAILVPFLGFLVDRYGGRAAVLLACAIVIVGVHLTLGLTMLNPVIPLVILGMSYSLYGVAIWPSVATVVEHRESKLRDENPDQPPPKLLGAAFGLSVSALNASMTVVPLIAAEIRVAGGSFMPVELFFAGLAVLGAVFGTALWIVDTSYEDGVLQRPEMASLIEAVSSTPSLSSSEPEDEQHQIAISIPAARLAAGSAVPNAPQSQDGPAFIGQRSPVNQAKETRQSAPESLMDPAPLAAGQLSQRHVSAPPALPQIWAYGYRSPSVSSGFSSSQAITPRPLSVQSLSPVQASKDDPQPNSALPTPLSATAPSAASTTTTPTTPTPATQHASTHPAMPIAPQALPFPAQPEPQAVAARAPATETATPLSPRVSTGMFAGVAAALAQNAAVPADGTTRFQPSSYLMPYATLMATSSGVNGVGIGLLRSLSGTSLSSAGGSGGRSNRGSVVGGGAASHSVTSPMSRDGGSERPGSDDEYGDDDDDEEDLLDEQRPPSVE
ncbi:major facilitator superfamily domain-containing protein [Entophlyctis helioformis]|nr:major facilitator superfamily domain-containing protein [Entophlyctis helioformis]